mgnify:CR=1 FL=1
MTATDLPMPGLALVPRTDEKQSAKDFKTDQEVRWCPGCGDYAILAARLPTAQVGLYLRAFQLAHRLVQQVGEGSALVGQPSLQLQSLYIRHHLVADHHTRRQLR